MKIDLHNHTNHSPCSNQTVKEMLDTAKKFGLDVVAITDHDSVSGIDEAIEYGKKIGIKVIPGLEITATSEYDVKSLEPHTRVDILGYRIDWRSNLLKKFYDELSILKIKWAKEVVQYLNEKDYQIDFDSLNGYSELFIIKQLIERNYCRNRSEAKKITRSKDIIKKYPFIRPSLKESINLIMKIGGIPVLAHPYRGPRRKAFSDQQVLDLIQVLKRYGLMGVETHHFFHVEEQRYDKLLKICKIQNLIPTIGSDHHSTSNTYKRITDNDKRTSVFSTINCDFNEIINLCLNIKSNFNLRRNFYDWYIRQ